MTNEPRRAACAAGKPHGRQAAKTRQASRQDRQGKKKVKPADTVGSRTVAKGREDAAVG
jgi:hypothetical protein